MVSCGCVSPQREGTVLMSRWLRLGRRGAFSPILLHRRGSSHVEEGEPGWGLQAAPDPASLPTTAVQSLTGQ